MVGTEVLTSPGFASDVLRLLLLYYVTRALENFYVKKQSHKNVSFVLSKPITNMKTAKIPTAANKKS